MRRVVLPLLLVLFFLAFAAPAQAERRVALVIGNGAYKDAPLKNPANDARDIAAALKRLNFEVIVLADATHQQMDAAVTQFGTKLRQGGLGLFYYAGHGLQVAGENYLVPVDAAIQTEGDVKFKCLNAGFVLAKMEDAGNGLNVVILDACRNNPFARSFRSAERGLAKMDASDGSLIAFATGPGKTAEDGTGKNGTYTKHLLQNIATPGLSLGDMFMRVRQGVRQETDKRQVPWEVSSLTGHVYLGSGAPTPPPPAVTYAAPPSPSSKPLDLKAEKQRLAEEAAQLKREKEELAQVQALQAEKDRLELERQKLAQAKADAEAAAAAKKQQLALAKVPSQPPGAASSGASGKTWTDPTTGMEFVWVPGGSFEMGCGSWDGECGGGEKPVHTVRLSAFWLAKYEVTQGQWQRVMGNNPSNFKKGDSYPVDSVSWNDTKEFISRLNGMGSAKFRLPTEAEWEYAARSGGRPEKYAGGGDVNSVAWYAGNSGGSTHAVGTKAPNGLGLYDMSGNVYEWVEDAFREYSPGYKNPYNFDDGLNRVFRGGSWDNDPLSARTAYRIFFRPFVGSDRQGFRLARTN